MNATLYKQMMKVNLKGFLNFAFGSALYMIIMFWMYPGIAKNAGAIEELVHAMPEGFTRAFGMQDFGSAEAFMSADYYGLILVLILAVVCVQLSTQLMATLVDRGSMAYLLSTPTTRSRVALTQAAVLTSGLFVIMAVTTAAGFAGDAWLLGDEYAFDTGKFLLMNVSAFLVFFALGGICFLVSSLCDDDKKARGISGAIAFGFFGLDLLSKISDSFDWIGYISLFALYSPDKIVSGEAELALPFALLAVIGVVSFGLAVVLFRRRDLPL